MSGTGIRRLALTCAALCLPLSVSACGSSSSPSLPAPPHAHLESIFEDELHLHSDPGGTLDLMRRLGVQEMRVYVAWRAFAPEATSRTPPAGFDGAGPAAYPAGSWAVLDRIVRDATQRGVGIDMTIGGPAPSWALGADAPKSTFFSWKPSDQAFGAFVRAVGRRYSGSFTPAGEARPLPRVDFWSIWNEPNYGPDLAPQAIDTSTVEVSPELYRGLLDAGWSALQQTGHSRDTILIGETAPRGITTGDNPGNFSGMVPLRFIRALYCVGSNLKPLSGTVATERGCPAQPRSGRFAALHPALFHATGFADHPYAQGGMPPNTTTPDEPDYADLASLPNLERTLDRARSAYGSFPPMDIYSTEFGYQTDPPETIAHTTSPTQAALYLNWAEYISWLDPRIRSYDQYLLTDPLTANSAGGFATGLQFKNNTPKPTYAAFRMPLFLPSTGHGADTAVWGDVRPAFFVPRSPAPVEIQYRSGPGRPFRTVKSVQLTDPHGYFQVRVRVPRTGQLRLQWSYPGGQRIVSRLASLPDG